MRILLESVLLVVALAAPFNYEERPHDSSDLLLFGPDPVEKWIMRVTLERGLREVYSESGIPKSAIDEYIAMEMEAMNPSANLETLSTRMTQWQEKWQHAMAINEIRKEYRAAGYPEEAITEYLNILDLSNINKEEKGKDARLQEWEKKWAPALEEELTRKTLSLAGFPDEAIQQYIALGLAHSGDANNRTEARREKWHNMWHPIVVENNERKSLKEAGYSAHAIDEYIREGLQNANDDEKTALLIKWHVKYDEEQTKNYLRTIYGGSELPADVLDEYIDLMLHSEKDVNGTRLEEWIEKWGAELMPGLPGANAEDQSRRQIFVKTAAIFERTNHAAQMLLSFAQQGELTEKKMEELKGYINMLPGYEGRLLKRVFADIEKNGNSKGAAQPM